MCIRDSIRSGVRPSERELAANDSGAGGGPGARTAPGAVAPAKAPVLGMSLGALDETTRGRLNLPPEVKGALVEGVDVSSDAGTKGVRRGDVITRANDRTVAAPSDVAAVVDAAKKAGRTNVVVWVY